MKALLLITALISLLCFAICSPFLLRLIFYFSPLMASTAACLVVLRLFIIENRGGKEQSGGVLIHVRTEEANSSFYKHKNIEAAGFLLLKEEDGSVVNIAGRIAVGGSSSVGAFVESFDSDCYYYEVDCLAQLLWDSYFGKFSKWNKLSVALK